MAPMRWGDFAQEQPDIAVAGRALLYQYGGVGLAFLATTRADGGPRTHPMCPLLTDTDLYGFIVPSPKRADLHRDGRYAMHSFPTDDNEDAFYLAGRAQVVTDRPSVTACAEQFARERQKLDPSLPEDWTTWELFTFGIDACLLTRTTGHGDPAPRHTVWRPART